MAALVAFSGLGLGLGVVLLPATTAGAATSVSIMNFSFQPATATVPAGSTVTWVNQDSTMHSVTSDTGAFDSGNGLCPPANCLAQGATFSHQFSTPGTYKYHCNVHTYMQGTVVVTGATATTPAPTAPPTVPPTTPQTAPKTAPPPAPSPTTTSATRSSTPLTTAPTSPAPTTTPAAAGGSSATTETTTPAAQGTTGGASTQALPVSHHRGSGTGVVIGVVALVALLGGGAFVFTRWRAARD